MNIRRITLAAWGPIKTILIVWVFLIMIIAFINFLFFDTKGLLYFLSENRFLFGIVSVLVASVLFLFWLIVWNSLIKAFFKEDLKYYEKNGQKLEN
ncbi:MAG TPA: hypothetical protein VMX55_07750 [candidate division Zixibacteria bacterium]|nr:hypothetical protein [candidate division Zixibacteria bacterium]